MQKINKRVTSQQYMVLNVLAFAEENGQAFENDALFLKASADFKKPMQTPCLRWKKKSCATACP